jgi:hypothetical protein
VGLRTFSKVRLTSEHVLTGWLAYNDELKGHVSTDDAALYPKHDRSTSLYNRDVETAVGSALAGIWVFGNAHYWNSILEMFRTTMRVIDEDERLGWMKFKHTKRPVWDRAVRDE